MCHNGANRTERGARGPESGIGAAAQALVQGSAWGSAWGFVRGSARGYARVCVRLCGGVECVGTGRVAGRLWGGVLRGGECCGGRAIGMEGGRGAAADGVAGRRGARVVVVVVVVSCGWPLAGLLRDCCGTVAEGWPVVEAVGCRPGRRLRGLLREWLLWGRNAPGEKCVGIAGFVAVWGGGWMWRS